MTHMLLAAIIIILLAGIAAAEPQPVDADWQRSDEVPQETPTAPQPEEVPAPTATPLETATGLEAEVGALVCFIVAGCGLFTLIAIGYLLRGKKR